MQLTLFKYETESHHIEQIRTFDIDGETWFAGKDVAKILVYVDTDQAIRTNVEGEDKQLVQLSNFQDPVQDTGSYRKGSKIIAINESGLYSLIFQSNKKEAKRFKRWITKEVIPFGIN